MRRKDREVKELEKICEILEQCTVCHLAFNGVPFPYVVPLNYGYIYEEGQMFLYFHSAPSGKKLEAFLQSPQVAFAVDRDGNLLKNSEACEYSMVYKSVLGCGVLEEAEGEEKIKGLKSIMLHYDKEAPLEFAPPMLQAVRVLRLRVVEMTGKEKGM